MPETSLRRVCTADELPHLVKSIVDRLRAQRGWSQEDVGHDLARDGGDSVTQASISQACNHVGERYEQLQLRIIRFYASAGVQKQVLFFFDTSATP